MAKLKTFFAIIGYIIFYVGGTFLWIKGIVFSTNHMTTTNTVVAAIFFPVAIYRGAESFWYKDPNDINNLSESQWDEKIQNDISTATEIINTYNGNDIDNVNTQISDFHDKISTYPKDKFNKIRNGVLLYLKYNIGMTIDFDAYLKNVYNEIDTTHLFLVKTNKDYDSLYNFYGLTQMQLLKEKMDSISTKLGIPTEKNGYTKDKLGEWIDGTDKTLSTIKETYSMLFYKMFKQNYDFITH